MKETIAFQACRVSPALTAAMTQAHRATCAQLAERSMIIWGEHCSECAAPTCYAACHFYSPRADGHCRRFANGIETVPTLEQGVAPISRILFRRWGKLEGRGPLRAFSPEAAYKYEGRATKVADWSSPFFARRQARRQTMRDQRAARGRGDKFDAFLIEGASLSSDTLAFTLTCIPCDKANPTFFQTQFHLTPNWSRTVIPYESMARCLDLDQDYLIQIEPVGDAEGIHIVLGLVDFVTWQANRPAANPASDHDTCVVLPQRYAPRKVKMVVWDLDHTLWDGILVEDGAFGLSLKPCVKEIVWALDGRGILQSVASKNNHQEAIQALKHHGLFDYMLVPQISWGPKSVALSRIASALNLGLESFVFIDDQSFERGEVSEAHPCVMVLPETAIPTLLSRPEFDVPVTNESQVRRAFYTAELVRKEAAQLVEVRAQDYDMDPFLRDCHLLLTVSPLGKSDVERVYELSQRTNQLTSSATRYTRDEVIQMTALSASNPLGLEAWTLRCQDRFGDYGLIGFVLMQPKSGHVLDFFLSCRIQRKRVEAALFSWLAGRVRTHSISTMTIAYKKTTRNHAVLELLEGLGFEYRGPQVGENSEHLWRDLKAPFSDADIVSVQKALMPLQMLV
jgi:FkbH-like protein